jgi:acetyl esterase/lipase
MTSQDRHPLVSYQPLRILFQLSYVVLVILRLPYYAAVSLIPSFRPNRKWSAKQTFMTRVSYWFLDSVSRVGITETLTLDPGKEGRRFQTIPVSTLNVYKGPLTSEAIKPAKVGGTWFPDAPGEDITSKIVILYFHGGAFVQGDGRTAQYGSIAKYFLEKGSGDAVFSVQYRLSGHGNLNPFPAALQDALSSYLFLLNELHIPAHQIILAGDSAGATLVTSLLRYLYEYGSTIDIPTPKCAVLLSPWVEPFYYDATNNPHRGTDFIPGAYGGKQPFFIILCFPS